jgi:hypothetical protein
MGALVASSVNYHREWAHHTFWEAFPDNPDAALAQMYSWVRGTNTMILNEDPTLPPVFTRFKDLIELEFVRSWPNPVCIMVPRQGAQIYAWTQTKAWEGFSDSRDETHPTILGWRYGEAYTWSITQASPLWYDDPEYLTIGGYGPDAYFSMLIYSTGRNLPEDVVMVHQLKERFYEHARTRSLIISLVEFVEKFGANTDPLMVKVIAMDHRWAEAREEYIRQDYEKSWSSFDQLLSDVSRFQEEAMALKNRTLFWVYVTEWCVITGTSSLAGFILWTLMVKRRYYKMVSQTRLRPPPGETGTEHPEYTNHRPWWRTTKEYSRLAIT